MRPLILILGLAVFASGCSERRFRQNAASAMAPTIQPNETFRADMSAYRKNGPQRWDVIVFNPPKETQAQPQEMWVMRVIGLPGENLEIRNDGIYIGGRRENPPDRLNDIHYMGSIGSVIYPYAIPPDTYFVAGDNTLNARDSRFWGALPRQAIRGKVKDK
jgi:signal peptidase I